MYTSFRGPSKKPTNNIIQTNFINWYHHHQNTTKKQNKTKQLKKKNSCHKSLVQDTPREMGKNMLKFSLISSTSNIFNSMIKISPATYHTSPSILRLFKNGLKKICDLLTDNLTASTMNIFDGVIRCTILRFPLVYPLDTSKFLVR
jgi:hypothetical protein